MLFLLLSPLYAAFGKAKITEKVISHCQAIYIWIGKLSGNLARLQWHK